MHALDIVAFATGLVALVVGAELLVGGAARLATALGVRPLIVGLTVVAFGTSAPELAVSIRAALAGSPGLALGNVVGSNIFNILFILGISALVAPLLVSEQLIRLDVPIMIGVSGLVLLLAWNGRVGHMDGALLAFIGIAYVAVLGWLGRKQQRAAAAEAEAGLYPPPRHRILSMVLHAVLILAGLTLLVVGSRWLVAGAVVIARELGVSRLVIGLTIVAAGTSLPEVATSIAASARGHREIAVGNIVGSNIFNAAFVLGAASLFSPHGVRVPTSALTFDIPVMVAVAVACLPIFFTGHMISRWEGALFVGYYVAYTGYLVLAHTRHELFTVYSDIMLLFVVPLTVITLGLVLVREIRQRLA